MSPASREAYSTHAGIIRKKGMHHAPHTSLAFVLSRHYLVDAVFHLVIVEQLFSELRVLAADCVVDHTDTPRHWLASNPYNALSDTSPPTIQRSRNKPSCLNPRRTNDFAEASLRGSISASSRCNCMTRKA